MVRFRRKEDWRTFHSSSWRQFRHQKYQRRMEGPWWSRVQGKCDQSEKKFNIGAVQWLLLRLLTCFDCSATKRVHHSRGKDEGNRATRWGGEYQYSGQPWFVALVIQPSDIPSLTTISWITANTSHQYKSKCSSTAESRKTKAKGVPKQTSKQRRHQGGNVEWGKPSPK